MEVKTICSQDVRNPLETRDFSGEDIKIRKYIFDIARKCYKKRNAVELDTPMIELFSIVKNLYGDEFTKSVYSLSDTTQQKSLILRYDLTVPLARYAAMNGLKQLTRYQIGKVNRKDDPKISKGPYREFYQADFDIVGVEHLFMTSRFLIF